MAVNTLEAPPSEPAPTVGKTVALLVGASHANALKRANETFETDTSSFVFRVLAHGTDGLPGGATVFRADGQPMLSPIIHKALATYRRRKPTPRVWLVSALSGNEANRLSLLRHPEAFDFVDPFHPGEPVDPTARLLPYDLLVDVMQRHLEGLERALGLFVRQSVEGVVQIAPPPPLCGAEQVRGLLSERTINAALRRGATKDDIEISPDSSRLRMWRLESRVTRAICERLGVHYLAPTNALIDDDGFRGLDSAGDAIHGNAKWGTAILDEAANLIKAQQEGIAHG